jgi:O-antigen ligase
MGRRRVVTGTATARSGRRTRSRPAPLLERLAQRHPIDVVDALTGFMVLSFCIPSPLIVGPIGASGTPANLVALGFLLWWIVAKLGVGQGVDRRPQPVHIALVCFLVPLLASVVNMYLRPATGKETSGALRGLLYIGALMGIALAAADGITSLERVHTLMRRVVHGVAFVAALGMLQYLTGYNAAGELHIPGLVRNQQIYSQGRSLFVRIQSTTVHPIELGALLGITLPVALHYAMHAKGRRPRQIAWIEALLIAAVLPLALSRTGIIAAVIGLIAIAMEWTWAQRARFAAFGVLFLGAMRAAVPGLLGTVTALFADLSQDNSTTGRTARYQIAGHWFLEHPWFGRGFNTLYPATHQVFDNAYLYQAVEQGIVGIVGLLAFYVILVCTARGARLRSRDPLTHGLAQAFAGVFVAMAIMYATADMGGFNMLMGVFFLMAGCAGAMWRLTGGTMRPPAESAISVVASA